MSIYHLDDIPEHLKQYFMPAPEIGIEQTPEQYINRLVEVFREVKRVLRDDGTLWVNIGDSYANDEKWGGKTSGKHARALHGEGKIGRVKRYTGLPGKNLIGIPWMLAFALRADGWYLRQDIIWAKPNPMPESVKDRCTKSHEYIFLLSKSKQYYYDSEAIKEPSESGIIRTRQRPNGVGTDEEKAGDFGFTSCGIGDFRNKRDVWTVTTKPYTEAHFAVFPPDLIEPCILAGAPFDGLVLDPFTGSGTTAVTALQNGRNFIGVELNPKYVTMAEKRIKKQGHYQERIELEG